jgi:hypothetical protein
MLVSERIAKPNKYTSITWVDDKGCLIANHFRGRHQQDGMVVVWLRVVNIVIADGRYSISRPKCSPQQELQVCARIRTLKMLIDVDVRTLRVIGQPGLV